MGNSTSKDRKEKFSLVNGLKGVTDVTAKLAVLGIGGIDEQDENGETPLFQAIRLGQLEWVSELLKYGADPNVISEKGFSPIHEAFLTENRDIILALLEADKLSIQPSTRKEFKRALTKGRKSVCDVTAQLAALKTDGIDEKNEDGETPLFRAIRSGDRQWVADLLKCGADPNVTSKKGLTPLHEVVRVGNQDMILTLLGVDHLNLRAKTKQDYTCNDQTLYEGSNVLHILSQRTEESVIKLSQVLCYFVDDEETDKNNNTPYEVAKMAEHAQMMVILDKCRRIWTKRVKSARKQEERVQQAQKDMLTEKEKENIRKHEQYLLGMKTIPVMAHLFSNCVLCDFDKQLIQSDCQRIKRKAAEYILHEVILTGPYEHLQHFREALTRARQEHLAKFLPVREP